MSYEFKLQTNCVIVGLTSDERIWWSRCVEELPLIADRLGLVPFGILLDGPTKEVVVLNSGPSGYADLELMCDIVRQFLRTFRSDDYILCSYGYTGDEAGGGIMYIDAEGSCMYDIDEIMNIPSVVEHLRAGRHPNLCGSLCF